MKVGYKTFKQVIDELVHAEALPDQLHAELDWLRKIRNRVYHEAYLPTMEESARAPGSR